MSKYSFYARREDYQEAFAKIEELESKLDMRLDWKKLKRVSLDELSTIIHILNRKAKSN